MSQKGSSFEREIARRLSLWWTNGERTDIFWRTSQSGGRATQRAKKGEKTFGSYGDIMAIDPIGQPLLGLVTIEVKKGYNRATIQDLLDKPERAAIQIWEKWITKVERDRQAAGSKSWLIIIKRDRRETLVAMPYNLYDEILLGVRPIIHLMMQDGKRSISLCTLDSFLNNISIASKKCSITFP